ncbi:hypothetical protein FHG87_006225 [Trinorchestia longiramus]|nr:hypothetical protein FHG87_006225 [Trinorchestia longiramus]
MPRTAPEHLTAPDHAVLRYIDLDSQVGPAGCRPRGKKHKTSDGSFSDSSTTTSFIRQVGNKLLAIVQATE